jgi:hypothetical protein
VKGSKSHSCDYVNSSSPVLCRQARRFCKALISHAAEAEETEA